MNEAEWQTREFRIDARLCSLNPPWCIIRYHPDLDCSQLGYHAVEELPIAHGLADYGLFVDDMLLGGVAASRKSAALDDGRIGGPLPSRRYGVGQVNRDGYLEDYDAVTINPVCG